MKIEIKSIAGALLFEGDFSCIADAVSAAVKKKADLRSADLRSADLSSADLRSANLHSADLRSADLSSADLSSADLSSADLRSADLRSADLSSADLRSAKNSELAVAMTRILPAGSLIGWKKLSGGIIAKLRIPEDAKRSHAFGRKCRAEFAEVLEMFDGKEKFTGEGVSRYAGTFVYRIGETVRPVKPFCEDFTSECASGIHFLITREEAEAYDV